MSNTVAGSEKGALKLLNEFLSCFLVVVLRPTLKTSEDLRTPVRRVPPPEEL